MVNLKFNVDNRTLSTKVIFMTTTWDEHAWSQGIEVVAFVLPIPRFFSTARLFSRPSSQTPRLGTQSHWTRPSPPYHLCFLLSSPPCPAHQGSFRPPNRTQTGNTFPSHDNQ